MSTCGIAVGQAELRFLINKVRLIFVVSKLMWKVASCSTSTKRNYHFRLRKSVIIKRKRVDFFEIEKLM